MNEHSILDLPDCYLEFDFCLYTFGGWERNGDEIKNPRQIRKLESYIHGPFFDRAKCPYCRSQLSLGTSGEQNPWDCDCFRLGFCANCGYWQWFSHTYPQNPNATDAIWAVSSIARTFETELPKGVIPELAQYFRRHPEKWHQVDPHALEIIVTDVLKANFEPCVAMHVGKPGDQGIDAYLIDSSDRQWFIQVKRRARVDKGEGFDVVQKLLGTLFLKDGRYGIIVSTADHFTDSALKTVKQVEQKCLIKLVNKSMLSRLLSPLIPTQPYMGFINTPHCFADESAKEEILSMLPKRNLDAPRQQKFAFWYPL